MLGGAPLDAPGSPGATMEPHIFIAISPGGPAQPGDRDAFARDVFATVPNLRDTRITTSEPLRIRGKQGQQILAHGIEPSGVTDVKVDELLRMGGCGDFHEIVSV